MQGHLDEAVAHRAVQAQRRVRVDDRDERRLADERVPVDAADEHRHLDARRRPSSRRCPRQCQVLSSSVANVRYWSRWRVSTGRSVGSSGPAALLVEDVEGPDEPHVVDEVGEVARPPAAVEVAHERRPADRAEDDVRATEEHVALGVPRVQPELARGQSPPATPPARDRGGPSVSPDPPALRPPASASSARSPRTSIPISDEDAQRRDVDRLDLVRREDLDRAVRVDQAPPRELADPGRGAPRSTPGGVGLGRWSWRLMLRADHAAFSRPSQRPRLPWRSQVTPPATPIERRLRTLGRDRHEAQARRAGRARRRRRRGGGRRRSAGSGANAAASTEYLTAARDGRRRHRRRGRHRDACRGRVVRPPLRRRPVPRRRTTIPPRQPRARGP